MELNPLQYPIGKFAAPEIITPEIRKNWIKTIDEFPDLLEIVASKLSETTLKKAYRPGGWTARQVIHHMFDSHMNCYIRFKKALNEENPTIMPYSENDWAHMPDGDDRHFHGVQRRDPAPFLGDLRNRINDRRGIHPELNERAGEESQVTIFRGKRGEPEAHAKSEGGNL